MFPTLMAIGSSTRHATRETPDPARLGRATAKSAVQVVQRPVQFVRPSDTQEHEGDVEGSARPEMDRLDAVPLRFAAEVARVVATVLEHARRSSGASWHRVPHAMEPERDRLVEMAPCDGAVAKARRVQNLEMARAALRVEHEREQP